MERGAPHDKDPMRCGAHHLSKSGQRLLHSQSSRKGLRRPDPSGGKPVGRHGRFRPAGGGKLEDGREVRAAVYGGEVGGDHAGHPVRD